MYTIEFKSKKILIKLLIILGIIVSPLIMSLTYSGFEYILMIMCIILLYIIAVSGLDILFGYCGQISLGHAAFYAIGAYGSAIMHNMLGLPILLTMVLAAIFAALIGALLAYPASKLVFHFLSLATIAFGEIVYQLLLHSPGKVTGDFYGLFSDKLFPNIVILWGVSFTPNLLFFYVSLIFVVLFLGSKWSLLHSKTGRAFLAIRENTHAANGMGINVRQYKIKAFATSAFFTAFAGGMYMHLVGFVHPDMFVQKQSVLFLTMLLFGGSGSLLGPIIGVVSVEMILESLRFLKDYQSFSYGILLLIVIVAMPGGLHKAFKDIIAWVKRKIVAKKD